MCGRRARTGAWAARHASPRLPLGWSTPRVDGRSAARRQLDERTVYSTWSLWAPRRARSRVRRANGRGPISSVTAHKCSRRSAMPPRRCSSRMKRSCRQSPPGLSTPRPKRDGECAPSCTGDPDASPSSADPEHPPTESSHSFVSRRRAAAARPLPGAAGPERARSRRAAKIRFGRTSQCRRRAGPSRTRGAAGR